MNRPHVQIDQPSCLESYRRALDALLPRLARVPGLVGVTLNGGMSRGYADALSEIDLTLFTQGDPALPVAQGITRVDGFLYDIKVEDYAACRARPWDMTALWDASYAQVLIDPSGRIEAMLAEKLAARIRFINCEYPLRIRLPGYHFRNVLKIFGRGENRLQGSDAGLLFIFLNQFLGVGIDDRERAGDNTANQHQNERKHKHIGLPAAFFQLARGRGFIG